LWTKIGLKAIDFFVENQARRKLTPPKTQLVERNPQRTRFSTKKSVPFKNGQNQGSALSNFSQSRSRFFQKIQSRSRPIPIFSKKFNPDPARSRFFQKFRSRSRIYPDPDFKTTLLTPQV